jgi:hypothetical protein
VLTFQTKRLVVNAFHPAEHKVISGQAAERSGEAAPLAAAAMALPSFELLQTQHRWARCFVLRTAKGYAKGVCTLPIGKFRRNRRCPETLDF